MSTDGVTVTPTAQARDTTHDERKSAEASAATFTNNNSTAINAATRANDAPAITSSKIHLRREQLWLLVFGIVFIALVIVRLQYSTAAICCGDYDGYYHIKWSRMLWENLPQGRLPYFDVLPFTTLNPNDYVDHHFLFHVLQSPFTILFGDMRVGAKISAALFATLAIFSVYWLMVRERIAYAPIWLIALIASSASFLYRINMTKAMTASLVCVMLGIYLLFRRRYVWLAPLAFIYVWMYSLWILLPFAAGFWFLVILWSERRIEWRPILWTALGCVAGLIINPYFPDNLTLLYEHIQMKAGVGNFETRVGGEWYPWDTNQFLGACTVALIAMVASYIAFDWSDKQRAQRPLFFMMYATFLMVATMYQKRYSEYFPPFAILFAAFTFQNLFDGALSSVARLPQNVMDELQPYLDRETNAATNRTRNARFEIEAAIIGVSIAAALSLLATELPVSDKLRAGIAFVFGALAILALVIYALKRNLHQALTIGCALLLGVAMFAAIRNEVREISDSSEPERYEQTMKWIRANVPPGEIVFNTDWDDFPKMYYYDDTHAYVSGLDPTYLLYKNPELARLYERITLGEEDNLAPLIRENFDARFIFTNKKPRSDNESNDFYFKIMESGWVEEVFDDGEHSTVLRILDERRPNDNDEAVDDEGGEQREGDSPMSDTEN